MARARDSMLRVAGKAQDVAETLSSTSRELSVQIAQVNTCAAQQHQQAQDTAVAMNQEGDFGIPVPDYVEENVSSKVVKLIQSYTGVVNKMVWRKQ